MNTYSPDALKLFTYYSYQTYLAAFGVAPPYDPSRLPQFWLDPGASKTGTGTKTYKSSGLNADGSFGIPFSLPEEQAATVNIPPPAATYPLYVVAPTDATRAGSTVNPVYLSLESDAQALMAALGGSSLSASEITGFPTTYPADELRRTYSFVLKGLTLNVGQLLSAENVAGVGAPGHWDASGAVPVWVSTPVAPVVDTRTPVPMPVRDLHADETVVQIFGGIEIVQGAQPVAAAAPSNNDALLAAINALPTATAALVTQAFKTLLQLN